MTPPATRPVRLALLFLALVCAVAGAPLERDLGQGLAYCRVHRLPDDLPTGESLLKRPCVLDLRYVHGDAAAAGALKAWLQFHATPRAPVFLLANAETSPRLLAPYNSPESVPGLVILGPAAPNFSPDIALHVSPETERQAYDALEKGTPITALITETVDKPRLDEEVLVREHLPDGAADPEAPPPKPAAPPPLIDSVLQRAVQLHRTLLALKKL